MSLLAKAGQGLQKRNKIMSPILWLYSFLFPGSLWDDISFLWTLATTAFQYFLITIISLTNLRRYRFWMSFSYTNPTEWPQMLYVFPPQCALPFLYLISVLRTIIHPSLASLNQLLRPYKHFSFLLMLINTTH